MDHSYRETWDASDLEDLEGHADQERVHAGLEDLDLAVGEASQDE